MARFFRNLRENFKQGLVLWLIWLGITAFFGYDSYLLYHSLQNGSRLGLVLPLTVMLFAVCLMWGAYLFPYVARFENSNREVLMLSFVIMLRNLPASLVLLALGGMTALLVWCCPLSILIAGGCCMAVQSLVLERVFHKYMPVA